jgi:uncharacterized membrane protein YgcG
MVTPAILLNVMLTRRARLDLMRGLIFPISVIQLLLAHALRMGRERTMITKGSVAARTFNNLASFDLHLQRGTTAGIGAVTVAFPKGNFMFKEEASVLVVCFLRDERLDIMRVEGMFTIGHGARKGAAAAFALLDRDFAVVGEARAAEDVVAGQAAGGEVGGTEETLRGGVYVWLCVCVLCGGLGGEEIVEADGAAFRRGGGGGGGKSGAGGGGRSGGGGGAVATAQEGCHSYMLVVMVVMKACAFFCVCVLWWSGSRISGHIVEEIIVDVERERRMWERWWALLATDKEGKERGCTHRHN